MGTSAEVEVGDGKNDNTKAASPFLPSHHSFHPRSLILSRATGDEARFCCVERNNYQLKNLVLIMLDSNKSHFQSGYKIL